MKIAMELTLDGLVRALRLTGHGLAEDAEAGYGRGKVEPGALVVRPFDKLRAQDEGYRNAAGWNEGFGE